MARNIGPKCRICRRVGEKLSLKGERCQTDKCAIKRRNYPPGERGKQLYRQKSSDYGLQLIEKQKARAIYGVMERQFRRYFKLAEQKKGITGENLLILLEKRLDNVVYRAGWAPSRAAARQLVRHGFVLVDNKKVDIPSYLVNEGEVISLSEKFKEKALKIQSDSISLPEWLKASDNLLEVKVNRLPKREEIDVPIKEELIVALYSR